MARHGPRSSYESDNARSKAVARRDVCVTIGRELRTLYEIPRDLPHDMLALLTQLREREE
jgi:hypothetical protein